MQLARIRNTAAGLALALSASAALAQAWPARPVKVVVPYGPGTAIDIVMRHLSEALTRTLNQPFVVENRPGAAGTVATGMVANAPPDGYTLLTDSSSHTSTPSLIDKLPYDVLRDFAGVSTVSQSTLVLVVNKSSGINSLAELVAAAKAKPGKLTMASAGVGSSTHLTGSKLNKAAGINVLHVPFKSTPDALTEVVAGRVDWTYTGVASAVALVKEGRLVPLALNGTQHSKALPNVPTVAEAGQPGATYPGWLGMMAHARTPREIIVRLNQEVVKAMATPDMTEKMLKAGTDAWTMSPEEFDAMRRREVQENAQLIKELNLKLNS